MGVFDIIFGNQSIQSQTDIIEYPLTCQGYTINYSDPDDKLCPTHGCTTYQTVEENTCCYGPKCRRLLHHY